MRAEKSATLSLNGPVVVDASLAVKWVLSEPYSFEADALLEDLRERGSRIMAPGLVAYEVTRVCYKRVRTGEMSTAAAIRALTELLGTLTDIEHDHTLHEQAM